MSNPAYLVDGQTEQKIIQKICPAQPVRLIGCNGDSVSLFEIARRIATQLNLLKNSYYPIICIIDKESRTESIEVIESILRQHIEELGHADKKIIIGIADKMIENWILADWDNFINYYELNIKKPQECLDGIGGKGFIRKKAGFYHETTDGVDMFLKSNPNKIFQNSPSFRFFISNLKKEYSCHYTDLIQHS